MDLATLEKIIATYGMDNIIGIGFDNSAALTFDKAGKFTDDNINRDIECLQFIEFDFKGQPYHVLKSIGDIQSIMIRDSGVNREAYDMINIRS